VRSTRRNEAYLATGTAGARAACVIAGDRGGVVGASFGAGGGGITSFTGRAGRAATVTATATTAAAVLWKKEKKRQNM